MFQNMVLIKFKLKSWLLKSRSDAFDLHRDMKRGVYYTKHAKTTITSRYS